MSRTLPALAVVGLLVLSGCATFGGVGTTREPFDVSDSPTDESATPDGSVDAPPVVAFDPLQDTAPEPFVLAEAHEDTLLGRSYTVQYTHRETYANGSRREVQNWTTTFGRNRSTFVQDRYSAFRNDSVRRQLYANGTHVWTRERSDGRPISDPRLLKTAGGDPLPPSDAALRAAPAALRSGLLAMNVTDVTKLDTALSDVDAPLFKVVGNETSTPNPYGNETMNATFTLFATEDGRVIEFAYEYTYEQNGNRIHAATRIQYRNVGVANVTRPEWVPANDTDARSIYRNASGLLAPQTPGFLVSERSRGVIALRQQPTSLV